jgi:predicted ATPase/DNA-binding CsgD family transcriptional regulator
MWGYLLCAQEHHVCVAVAGMAARAPDRRPGALPSAPNALVGRDEDLATLVCLLTEPGIRLVTLTGPPGVGKTRLAVAAAASIAERFRDGVVFVDLTAIRDPELVPIELAGVLGVAAAGDQLDALARTLRARHVLVVLDNFEHVLDAAPTLVGPLDACPRLRLLVTSRERLHLHAEREVPLEPLALPADDVTDPDRFAATPAVAMLLERVRAFQSGFAVTPANREALAEICVRLDGLPLAIELAAARLKLFTPGELTFRLRHRMKFLTGGARDIPDRHRTLRAALTWSHNLLSADERTLFRRLSVFVGGWTLEAAEAVCAGDFGDVMETTASLVDKSLIYRTNRRDLAEFAMLESLREFAAERLAEHGEADATRVRHARHYAALSVWVEATIGTAEEAASTHRVGVAESNLRAAMNFALTTGRHDWALPLASAVGWYCYTRGRLGDGHAAVELALRGAAGKLWCCAAGPSSRGEHAASAVALACALLVAGVIAFGRGDLDRAEVLLTRAGKGNVGKRREAIANAFLGHVARARGDHRAAVSRYEAAATLHGELGDEAGVAWSWYDLGLLARRGGDLEAAARQLWAGLERFRELDHGWASGCAAWALATVELRRGRPDEAAALLAEALDGFEGVGDGRGVAQCLEAAATLLVGRRDSETAAHLLAAAAAVRERLAAPLPDEDRVEHDAVARQVRRALGPQAAERARREGRVMPEAAAVAIARAAVAEPVESPELPNPLTGREREVALLVARGRTNRQIGRALGIAEKTTEVHVHNIIRKLGACSRAEVAAWVASSPSADPYMVPPISQIAGRPYT